MTLNIKFSVVTVEPVKFGKTKPNVVQDFGEKCQSL